MTGQFIVDFIDTEGARRSRYVDIDETADHEARERSIRAQVESRTVRVAKIQKYYRKPETTRGKP